MKYNVEIFARKKDIDLNQTIYSNSGNFTSLQELLEDYANRYYKHKESERLKGHETNCMREPKH